MDNAGHGPGYRYDRPVGPPGGVFGFWVVVALGAFLGWLFGV